MKRLNVMAVIRVLPGHLTRVEECMAELALRSRAEKGCVRYEVFADEAASLIFTQEVWTDAAAEAAHLAGPNVAAALERVRSWLDAPPQIHRCKRVA